MADVYLCDRAFQRIDIIEDFVSMVWVDRYYSAGDVELTFTPDAWGLRRIRMRHYLSFEDSTQYMLIESITEDSKTKLITVRGRDLRSLFDRRINKGILLEGNPMEQSATGAIVESFRKNIKDTPVISDRFENLVEGTHYWPWGGGPMGFRDFAAETVYAEMVSIGESSNVGWTVEYYDRYKVPSGGTYWDKLVFYVFYGIDRSIKQNDRTAVVFDARLENLENVSRIQSEKDWANVVFVKDKTHSSGGVYVYISGFVDDDFKTGRRVMVTSVDGEDRTRYTEAQWADLRRGYARRAARKRQRVDYLDGRLVDTIFNYRWDYHMGDLVTIGQDRTSAQDARIVEYIYSKTENGIEQYPTFKIVE